MPIKSKGIALPRLNRKFLVRANNGTNIASAANNEELMRVSRTIARRVCTDNSLLSLQLFDQSDVPFASLGKAILVLARPNAVMTVSSWRRFNHVPQFQGGQASHTDKPHNRRAGHHSK